MEDSKERTLLLVDDETNILSALRRLFRRDGYNILTANGGAEGLELLQQEKVGVIISDQRMPSMTGSEFLHRVKELYPDTVRIILSGYTDLESVTDSINRGAIYKFLTKPWDDELLREHVREAFRIRELNEENQRLTTELREANSKLAARVEKTDKALQFNVQALRIAQDILEELPMTVLGVSQGMIVVANRRARQRFTQSPILLGEAVEDVCPEDVLQVYRQAVTTNETVTGNVTLHGELFRCRCQRNTSDGPHEGFIVTLRKVNL